MNNLHVGWLPVSLDLQDAYLHIPIRPQWKFLQFALSTGERFQFRSMCFGLRTASRMFTKVVLDVGPAMNRLEVPMFQYLDDWLVVHPDRRVL